MPARARSSAAWSSACAAASAGVGILARVPLGTFDERVCTCVRFRLARSVPVEPRLRLRLVADDGSGLEATGVVRPWRI